ncbi:MAG TPA: GAF domain-containing sensor histidine kinase [Anaerolineales bacterium]|nr:GAF domain-containing sensor histidine kinase [Anaerolineales bacterium]
MSKLPDSSDLEILYNAAPWLVAKTDKFGLFKWANPTWLKLFKLEAENITNYQLFDLIRDPKKDLFQKKFTEHLLENVSITIEIEMAAKNDTRIIELLCLKKNDEVFLSGIDITKRVAGDKIREEQRKSLDFRQLVEDTLSNISGRMITLGSDEIDDAINEILEKIGTLMRVDRSYVFLFDKDHRFMSNTHEWCNAGITSEIKVLQNIPLSNFPWWMEKLRNFELIDIPFVSKLPSQAASEKLILEIQEIKSVFVVPLERHTQLIGFVGFDAVREPREWSRETGILMRIVGDTISNALTRVEFEKLASESRNRIQTQVQSFPDVLISLDREGKILNFQPSLDAELNKPFESLSKDPLQMFTTQVDYENLLAAIRKTIREGSVNSVIVNFDYDEWSKVLEARIIKSGDREALAILRDITAQVNQDQTRSDYINKATHELRNPIATMLLMTNLLEEADTQEKKTEYWTVLKGELNREKLLIDDLLAVGKLENQQQKLNYKMVDLSDLIHEVTSSAQIQANDKQIALRLTFHSSDKNAHWLITSDENVLKQIFVNLVNNAIKYTGEQGKVNIDLLMDDSMVTIKVKDNGIGIPSEDIPNLFTRFYRGRNAVNQEIQGTGIGLFIVKSLVDKLGGTIKVDSQINSGSTFSVTIPKNPPESA